MPLTWTHLIGVGLLLTMTTGLATVHSASVLDNKNNGYHTAKVGAECVTREAELAAPTITQLERAFTILQQDSAAARKLFSTQEVVLTKPGITVFVEERRDNKYISVRPKGQVDTVWMMVYSVECPITAAKKSK